MAYRSKVWPGGLTIAMRSFLAGLLLILSECHIVAAPADFIEWDEARFKAEAIETPYPAYPRDARYAQLEGTGIFDLTLRDDGRVSTVTTHKSTRHASLDAAAVNALKKWRFRPGGRWKRVRVPIFFVLSEKRGGSDLTGIGVQGEALSSRQVQQSIIATPRIYYPMRARLQNSQGVGLYEMRVDSATGKVSEVVIIKSTGERILDLECMRALGRWRFKPGTVTAARLTVNFNMSWRSDGSL